jgi:hypothetical protein
MKAILFLADSSSYVKINPFVLDKYFAICFYMKWKTLNSNQAVIFEFSTSNRKSII